MPNSWKYHKKRNLFADDPVLAQQAADLVLEKLELRGAIIPVSTGVLGRMYRLSETAAKQLDEAGL